MVTKNSDPKGGPIAPWGRRAALARNDGHNGAVPALHRRRAVLPLFDASLCSAATLRLATAKLAESGLSLDRVHGAGVFLTDDASLANPDFAPKPALILPYFDAQGQPITFIRDDHTLLYARCRYLVPTGFALPKGRKYDQPAGSGTPPYFGRAADLKGLESGDIDALCITEGELKQLAMMAAGLPTVAIAGVYNFAEGGSALHSTLAAAVARCKSVYIVFDSDAATNPDIQTALWRLTDQLAILGKRVHQVCIPASAELDGKGFPKKVGADDFIVAHGAEALKKLILDTPAVGERAPTDNGQISVAEILERQVLPVEELIPGWIEKGIPNFLCGAGGVHKSRLAMQWGLCINAGASVWGIEPQLEGIRKPKATLVYVSAEDDANELARRAQGICSALKLKSPSQGVFIPRRGLDSALVMVHESAETDLRPFYHELVAKLHGIPGHKLVVLDSAYDFVRFVGRAKIDEDSVNYYIKVLLQGLCDHCDATLLIPWHPSQAGSERENQDGWSVAWHNAPRARLGLKAVKDAPDTYELSVTKRNHGRKGEPIQIRYCDGALMPLDSVPDAGKAESLQEACVKVAIEAAAHGIPVNRARGIPEAMFREAARAIGRRPRQVEIKNALEEAVMAKRLSYVTKSRHRAAGYYPPDVELADTLAHNAKRAATVGTDDAK